MTDLDRLIDPRVIAIAGVSGDERKHGARALANLRAMGFAGDVWGVNPRLPEIDGLDVYPGVAALPTPPDLVVAAVPAPAVAGLVGDCKGVGAVIVFASGFGETGPDGLALQAELVEAAASAGTRLLGPNSGGVIRPDRGLAASFLTCLDRPAGEIRTGPVAIVTQSGGTGSYLHNLAAARLEGIAVSISTGNEADVKLGEAIDTVTQIEGVEVVLAVVESIRDGTAFIEAVRSAHAHGKRVVVCPLGHGARSETLMTSHTGALAVPRAISRGVYESLGVAIAETPAEAYDMASVMARTGRPSGRHVAMVTHSGGVAILLSDLAEDHGLALPQPSPAMVETLEMSLDHGSATNPLDLGGIIGGPGRFAEVVSQFAVSGEYDVVLAVSTAHPPDHTPERVESLLASTAGAPVVHLWMAGDQAASGLTALRQAGAPVTEEPRAAIRALAALSRGAPAAPGVAVITGPPENWGIPPLAGLVAVSNDDAVAAAEHLGYPVVVKLESQEIAHKTDIGGVRLDLGDAAAVATAHDELMAVASAAGVGHAGSRVQRYRPGLEMIVGAVRHPSFGPVVSVGVGGTLTEVVGDVAFAPAPVDVAGAARMIDRMSAREILDGRRGAPPADVSMLAEIVSLVSRGFAGSDLLAFEMNPLTWDGAEWIAVDWLMSSRGDGS